MDRCDSCGLVSRPREQIHAVGCEKPLPCPSCAALRKEMEVLRQARLSDPLLQVTFKHLTEANARLREAVEWACANAPIVVNSVPGHTQFVAELRRRAKEG